MTIPATTSPGTASQVVAEVKQQLRELNQETQRAFDTLHFADMTVRAAYQGTIQ
jgi:hypothetical protein